MHVHRQAGRSEVAAARNRAHGEVKGAKMCFYSDLVMGIAYLSKVGCGGCMSEQIRSSVGEVSVSV